MKKITVAQIEKNGRAWANDKKDEQRYLDSQLNSYRIYMLREITRLGNRIKTLEARATA